MAELDVAMRAMANEMLATFGKSVSVLVTTSPTYNRTTGLATETTGDPSSIQAVLWEVDRRYVDGDVVQMGDMNVGVAAIDWEGVSGGNDPSNGLCFTIDSKKWKVVDIIRHYSGDLVAFYVFRCRR